MLGSHGPIKETSLQLLFRYHVLPLEAQVSTDGEKFKVSVFGVFLFWSGCFFDFCVVKRVSELPEVFALSRRNETIDPTDVPSF